ncbi:MAG: transaldolase [Chloroflexi bacterium]|nr:transaldolase [Chloroflexota bacterium]
MKSISELRVKIFADGADIAGMLEMYRNPLIKGFTTNPTLMRKAGVTDYEAFAREVLRTIKDRPISFEVFSDDFAEMERQARKIAQWGSNVYVKIPITNTRAESSADLIRRLTAAGVKLNITAMTTLEQIRTAAAALAGGANLVQRQPLHQRCVDLLHAAAALAGGAPALVSLFAGRVADTGRDPVPMIQVAVEYLRTYPHVELLWASPRELLNIFQADDAGCHVITVTNDLLKKLDLVGKDLDAFSLETVQMFHGDAAKAGYVL